MTENPIVLIPTYPVRGKWLHGELISCSRGYEIRIECIQKSELREPLWLNVEKLEAFKAEIDTIINTIKRIDGESE